MFAYPGAGNEGYSVDVEHTIPLTTRTPIACRPRRLPTRWKAEVKDEVRRLRREGIFRPSTSGYAAPISPVRKSDGSLRLCVDYRQLNGKTRDTAKPTGNLQEVIESLSGAKFFSILDLARGYFQVPTVVKDKKKTAFRTPSGLYEFNRMHLWLEGYSSNVLSNDVTSSGTLNTNSASPLYHYG